MKALVTGISGYVGSLVAARLVADGHQVRGFSRDPARAPDVLPAGVHVLSGDAVTGEGLADALAGIEVAFFLIHSMEPASEGRFAVRELAAAHRFAKLAREAGVGRIVYLGGLLPSTGPYSAHLASRLAVERVLMEAIPGSVALRASIVIGARSRSFRFLVRLVERLPVLALPAWHVNRTAPIDERDVVAALTAAAVSVGAAGQTLDLGGPDVVTYGELIDRIAELMLVNRPAVHLTGVTLTPIASRIAAVLAGESHGLVGPLMESLDSDLLPRDDRALEILHVRPHRLDAAIEHALAQWEQTTELTAR